MKKSHKICRVFCTLLAAVVFSGTCGCSYSEIQSYIGGATETVQETAAQIRKNIELKKKMDSLDPPKEVKSISQGKYGYESLSRSDQVVYDQMLDAINHYEEEVTLSATEGEALEQVFSCIKADYGGLFWVDSYRYTMYQKNSKTKLLAFSPNFTMTKEERDEIQEKIDRKVKKYLAGLEADASDFEKVRYVYQKLIQKVDYNLEAENSQNIISVFLGRETVCQGYADATQYLLDLLDIPCTVITGTANNGPHAWNMVKLDGDWYYVDTTWGNSAYHDEYSGEVRYVQYDYLNITDEELMKSHQPEMSFALPACVAIENNYYVHEGKYFTKADEESYAQIGQLMKEAYSQGQKSVSVKFSSEALSRQARDYFLNEYHIRDYCSGLSQVYYNTDSDMNIFTIIFP